MYSSQRVGTSLVGPNMRSELEASNICSESKSSKLIRRRRQPAPIPTMINILQMSIVSTRGSQEVITYEDDTVDEVYLSTTNHRKILVTWRSIGYGFQWQSRYPYGSVLPSLRVFPITESMRKYQYIIENSSLYEIQKMFHSGQMHPFTQDVRGRTLLHVSLSVTNQILCLIYLAGGSC